MVNGSLQLSNITYNTTIDGIKNSNIAIPHTTYYGETDNPVITNFKEQEYTMSYQNPPIYATSSDYKSYANINVTNMTVFSGDVHRIKTYMKSRGALGASDYELINDTVVETKELLIDSSSIIEDQRTGYFYDQATINT